MLGMVARVLHPDLPHADLALPTLLAVDLPPIVGALTLAGVLAAEISSADAVLFMLSTSSSQDLYRRFIAPEATDTQVLRVARMARGRGGHRRRRHGGRDPHGGRRVEDLLRRRHGDAVRAGRGVAGHARAVGSPKAWPRWASGLTAWAAVAFGVPDGWLAGLPAPAAGLVASALGPSW